MKYSRKQLIDINFNVYFRSVNLNKNLHSMMIMPCPDNQTSNNIVTKYNQLKNKTFSLMREESMFGIYYMKIYINNDNNLELTTKQKNSNYITFIKPDNHFPIIKHKLFVDSDFVRYKNYLGINKYCNLHIKDINKLIPLNLNIKFYPIDEESKLVLNKFYKTFDKINKQIEEIEESYL